MVFLFCQSRGPNHEQTHISNIDLEYELAFPNCEKPRGLKCVHNWFAENKGKRIVS